MKLFTKACQLVFDVFLERPKPRTQTSAITTPTAIRRAPLSSPPTAAPDLRALWLSLRNQYFPERSELDNYRVLWSGRRHTSTLASCNSEARRILVAPVMKLPECVPFLEPLLYHEMCHAALGRPKRVNGRRVIHGREFKALERLHPGIARLDTWIKLGGWRQAVRKHRRTSAAASRSTSAPKRSRN